MSMSFLLRRRPAPLAASLWRHPLHRPLPHGRQNSRGCRCWLAVYIAGTAVPILTFPSSSTMEFGTSVSIPPPLRRFTWYFADAFPSHPAPTRSTQVEIAFHPKHRNVRPISPPMLPSRRRTPSPGPFGEKAEKPSWCPGCVGWRQWVASSRMGRRAHRLLHSSNPTP